MHWSPLAEAYVTPVSDRTWSAWRCWARPARSYDELLAQVPTLRDRLGGADWVTPVRGAGPLRQAVTGRVAGRVLLVGDAAGYVDALTGEGIRTGLACARAAVAAVAAADPAAYERDWRRLTRSYRVLTSGLLAVDPARARPPPHRRRRQLLPPVFGRAVESLAG